MYKTRHIQERMTQRGIVEPVLNMLLEFGISDGEKIILSKKNCKTLSEIFAKMKKITDKMAEKGGYTLVASGDALITTYRLNSFNLSKAKRD